MRTAETIVSEYLERGYSVECLRVLAENRSEPLASEMLAILGRLQPDDQAPEAGRESRDIPETAGAGGGLFFVASDDETVSAEGGVDFDIMAEIDEVTVVEADSAEEVDSVAEILIGETAGSEVMSLELDAESVSQANEYAMEAAKVWSRFSGNAEHVVEAKDDMREDAPAPAMAQEESSIALVFMGDDWPTGPKGSPDTDGPDGEDKQDSPLAAGVDGGKEQAGPAVAAELADIAPAAELTEASVDYLPESKRDLEEADGAAFELAPDMGKHLLLAAQEVIAKTAAAAAAKESAPAAAEPVEPRLHPLVAAATAELEENKPTRKERRRRERAEKKKAKEEKKGVAVTASSLPEIILARSEGTDTLLPETAAAAADSEGMAAEADVPGLEETVHQEVPLEPLPEMEAPTLDTEKRELVVLAKSETDSEAGSDALAGTTVPPGSEVEPTAHPQQAFGDHLMIVANGGMELSIVPDDEAGSDLFASAGQLLALPDSEEAGDNVILFRNLYPVVEVGVAGDDEEDGGTFLHMVPPAEASDTPVPTAAIAAPEKNEEKVVAASLSQVDERDIIRALVGMPVPEGAAGWSDECQETEGHTILTLQPDSVEGLEREAAARAELEQEYQTSLDEFARRILSAQAAAAENETKTREKAELLAAREVELAETRRRHAAAIADALSRLEEEREKADHFKVQLAEVGRANEAKAAELRKSSGMREEHQRLYLEFEDLRKAYNEVVTDVMPGLQSDRDDLALTLERQCIEGETLRSSLFASRRRLAAGYSLGAAAVMLMVALPLAGWLKSGEEAKSLALEHQQSTELRGRLEKAEKRNVDTEKSIFDLERKTKLASIEMAKLEQKNGELSRLADQRSRELASLKSSSPVQNGAPTRASTMALQASPRTDGTLRVNEVRDPAGRIDQVVASNRQQNAAGAPGLASAPARVAVSAVARSDAPAMRPPGTPATAASRSVAAAPSGAAVASASGNNKPASAKPGTSAKVKAGEGVAQVVYRVMGTRDPEVIDWVIRENNIKKDRRGNPRIYPEQEIRLPQDGTMTRSASVSGR